jgi:hypothetical protein
MCVETSIRTRYSRGPDVRVAVNARRLTAGSRDRLNVSKDERRALAARVVGRAVTTANERKVMAAQRSKKKGSSRLGPAGSTGWRCVQEYEEALVVAIA